MVRGLDRFSNHFREFSDRYVLIGGTACDMAMTEAGLSFRATHDLDIVLCIEALDREFAVTFWSFIKDGGYGQKENSTGERKFYRFQKPTDNAYPKMLELFSRAPGILEISEKSHLTPIPIDSEVSSLSAILLDEDYYRWIHDGKIMLNDVPIVRTEHLIPLKARAWLDMCKRKGTGEHIDNRSIKKHKKDVFRLAQIINPDYTMKIPEVIRKDMQQFVNEAATDDSADINPIGVGETSFSSLLEIVKNMYHLD